MGAFVNCMHIYYVWFTNKICVPVFVVIRHDAAFPCMDIPLSIFLVCMSFACHRNLIYLGKKEENWITNIDLGFLALQLHFYSAGKITSIVIASLKL